MQSAGDREGRKRNGDAGRPAPVGFGSEDELLTSAVELLKARQDLLRTGSGDAPSDEQGALAAERGATAAWHSNFEAAGDELTLCARCRAAGLTAIEREIVAALVAGRLGMIERKIETARDLAKVLGVRGARVLQVMRALADEGRLARAGLIAWEDPDVDLLDRHTLVDPVLVEYVLQQGKVHLGMDADTEQGLYDKLSALTRALSGRAQVMGTLELGIEGCRGDLFRATRRVGRLLEELLRTLELHPRWKLRQWLPRWSGCRPTDEMLIQLALLGKELGHVSADNQLVLGIGLARAVSSDPSQVRAKLALLMPQSALIRAEIIKPCGGDTFLLSGDPGDVAAAEFELTEKSIEMLGLAKASKKRSRDAEIREPRLRMSRLVLSEDVRRALRMAVAQARNARTLFSDWGLGDAVPYGRGVTLLFAGPPGVGKTAAAEALAHELGRPILVADYSRIQNCFVGETEKGVVKTFRKARELGAVLFWDEADAMFYDRSAAVRTWEAREVNVLLQELERFEGVCVLATNRLVSLDRALERRISMKVRFERPDVGMRRQIWRVLLPHNMPLARDVDVKLLAEEDLTGGEITNVILNASRLAVLRCEKGPVTMADFREGVRMEAECGWGRTLAGIGFRRRG